MRVAKTMSVFGSVKPTTSKSQKSPFASAEAQEQPDHRGDDPDVSASTITDQSTCRREAPTVRMVANSRVR